MQIKRENMFKQDSADRNISNIAPPDEGSLKSDEISQLCCTLKTRCLESRFHNWGFPRVCWLRHSIRPWKSAFSSAIKLWLEGRSSLLFTIRDFITSYLKAHNPCTWHNANKWDMTKIPMVVLERWIAVWSDRKIDIFSDFACFYDACFEGRNGQISSEPLSRNYNTVWCGSPLRSERYEKKTEADFFLLNSVSINSVMSNTIIMNFGYPVKTGPY